MCVGVYRCVEGCVEGCVGVCSCVEGCVRGCVSKAIFNMTNVYVYYTNLQPSLGKISLYGDIKSFDKVYPY